MMAALDETPHASNDRRVAVTCTPKGELTLKGLHKPMPAYEVQT